jgi:tyrosyl-tRNA synthetase
MFGKIMSISDELMWRYYLLLTDKSPKDTEEMRRAVALNTTHPLDAKKELARTIVADFCGEAEADKAQAAFAEQFQKGSVASDLSALAYALTSPEKLFRVLAATGIAPSGTEAQRQIKGGAVDLSFGDLDSYEWQTITDPTFEIDPKKHNVVVVRYGKKRQFKLSLKP